MLEYTTNYLHLFIHDTLLLNAKKAENKTYIFESNESKEK